MVDRHTPWRGAGLLACAFAACLSAGAARAAEPTAVPTYNAIDAETLKKIVATQGQAQIAIDNGDPQGPVIKVQVAVGGGLPYSILMDDCDNGQPNRCKSLEFRAALPAGSVNFAQINGFNQNMRYATAYLTEKGEPQLRMDANLRGGVTADFIAYTVRIFMNVTIKYVQQAK